MFGFIADVFGYLLNALYYVFNNYGIAIIIFSVILRLILLPITYSQQKSLKKNTKVQKQVQEIQNRYKNDQERMNQEMMAIYKKEGISPFSGCLSGIVQIIIILSVFYLVSQPLTHMKNVENSDIYVEYNNKVTDNGNNKVSYKEIAIINAAENDYKEIENKLKEENIENKEELENKKNEIEKLRLNMNFLGIDLSKVPTQSLNDFRVYIIPILYVVSSFISTKLTTSSQKSGKETNESEPDPMQGMNKGMTLMMPIMSVSIAIIAPLGLALYWLISNVLMIIERLIINKIVNSKEEEKNA